MTLETIRRETFFSTASFLIASLLSFSCLFLPSPPPSPSPLLKEAPKAVLHRSCPPFVVSCAGGAAAAESGASWRERRTWRRERRGWRACQAPRPSWWWKEEVGDCGRRVGGRACPSLPRARGGVSCCLRLDHGVGLVVLMVGMEREWAVAVAAAAADVGQIA